MTWYYTHQWILHSTLITETSYSRCQFTHEPTTCQHAENKSLWSVLDCNGVSIPHSSPQDSMWRVGQKECKKVRSMVVYIFNFSIQEADAGRLLMNSRLAWYTRPRAANLPSSCPDQKKKKVRGVRVDHFKETAFFFHTQQSRCTFELYCDRMYKICKSSSQTES